MTPGAVATGAEVGFEDDRMLVLGAFIDMGENCGVTSLCGLLIHCGIGTDEVNAAGGEVMEAVLAHYRTRDGYDLERLSDDLLSYGPTAKAIRKARAAKVTRDRAHDAD